MNSKWKLVLAYLIELIIIVLLFTLNIENLWIGLLVILLMIFAEAYANVLLKEAMKGKFQKYINIIKVINIIIVVGVIFFFIGRDILEFI